MILYAVIAAGGKGSRVAAVNGSVPKPMLNVAGKPVLQWQIECLRRQGIVHIILTINHLGEQIKNYFGDGCRFGVDIEYIQEETPLGTAGALYYLKDKVRENFLYINGDLIFDVDMPRLLEFHQEHQAAATLLTHPNDHPYDSGIIVADENGQVQQWLTKEDERGWHKNCVNAGVHVISPKFLEKITAPEKIDLDRHLLKPMVGTGELYACQSPEYVKDMGTPERIAEVERDILSGLVQGKSLCQKQKAIFLDRDGTINKYVGFLRNIEDLELLDGAVEAIRRINRSGYLAVVVTNQPVIARGEATWAQLKEIHNKLETLLGKQGAYLDDIFICPHHPDKGFVGEVAEYKVECDCRKPKPGLLLQAAEKYNIDLAKSWLLGDSDWDMAAGKAAGCQVMKISEDLGLLVAVQKIGL